MKKKKNKQIAVIGLGAFGTALVKTLCNEGADVVAVDHNMDHLDEVKHLTSNTICFNATDSEELVAHGITDADVAVIAIGENFEPVVLIAMELIKNNVPIVYARAGSTTQEQILKKIGVTEIIHPERQVAERMGKSIHKTGMYDLLDLDRKLSIYEIDVPDSMVKYSVKELDLRSRYHINILTVKRRVSNLSDSESTSEGPSTLSDSSTAQYNSLGIPSPSLKFQKGDKMVVLGTEEDCNRLLQVNK